MMNNNIDLVLFGAKGDLSERKLFPALYQLDRAGLLGDSVRIAGLARQDISSKEFIAEVEVNLKKHIPESDWEAATWRKFSRRLSYIKVDFSHKKDFLTLKEWLVEKRTAIYYLATPPSLYGSICNHLDAAGCVDKLARIVLEKPIGKDLESSRAVNATVGEHFDERNIYRIDHYLGKETVQNLLALRFANRMINSQWDNTCVLKVVGATMTM
jgi:glucose-6-phosphate 1-dehydrogenase